jgi:raffinose/stachyose/melibiose transport system substrate-binding protein
MRKSYRFLTVVLMVVMVALSFTSRTAFAQNKVTIHWWHLSGEPGDTYWKGLADAYMKMHPDVNIEITSIENAAYKQKLVTVMQAGDPPDLFHSWGGAVLWTYAQAGQTRNIAPELTANNNEWKDSFSVPSALELYGQNGEYYGVPFDWGAVGVFYNKALFKKAGLDPDKPPKTWSEFLSAVKTLKAAGITPMAIGEKEKWPGHFIWVYLAVREGGQAAFLAAYNRTGKFTDPPFVKAGEDLKQLVDLQPFQEGFLGATYPDSEAVMGNGKAAMEVMGQWSINVQKSSSASGKGLGDDLGWFPFPMVEGGKGDPTDAFGGGDGFAVGKNAPDATVDFLKFLSSKENQIAGVKVGATNPPVVKGADVDIQNDPILSAILKVRDNAKYFQLYYDQFLPPAVAQAVLDATESIFAGTGSPQDAAQMIEDAAAQELKGTGKS